MDYPFLKGDRDPRTEPVKLPKSRRVEFRDPSRYLASEGLIDAVNVALLLGQPLLLTGEPGTGKSELAYYAAWELGLDKPEKFETRSDSESGDLFYTYDVLRRFQHAQRKVEADSALPYIEFRALGRAIMNSLPRESVSDLLDDGAAHYGPKRSVVLIDEIDKAPRDFPNNILNEIDQLYFKIPELDDREVAADRDLQPVVIITSNSEKDLPAAFLRRCVFFHIPFPGPDEMMTILEARVGSGAAGATAFFEDALSLFYMLRDAGLRKKPSTSELLEWITAMRVMGGESENPLADDPSVAARAFSALRKAEGDGAEFEKVINRWSRQRTP